MPRRWNYDDDDSSRLPHGMERLAYDEQTQKYTFRDVNDGSIWESETGSRYGQLTRVGGPVVLAQLREAERARALTSRPATASQVAASRAPTPARAPSPLPVFVQTSVLGGMLITRRPTPSTVPTLPTISPPMPERSVPTLSVPPSSPARAGVQLQDGPSPFPHRPTTPTPGTMDSALTPRATRNLASSPSSIVSDVSTIGPLTPRPQPISPTMASPSPSQVPLPPSSPAVPDSAVSSESFDGILRSFERERKASFASYLTESEASTTSRKSFASFRSGITKGWKKALHAVEAVCLSCPVR
ncbi:hypothetical protein EJ06DRAFT_524488 [Trichodelitschia bisporula]|uniref:Uncharacterized protein n=1 Tax=Trichodelitschia bisporula TaxID=703511 RepID=A0A6G1HL57_9PEZI|nr:hypothetical protein EJ06DRAFT_524488 [Trichodelitschia bisporula]